MKCNYLSICLSSVHLSFRDYTNQHVLVKFFLVLCSFSAMNILTLC